MFGNLSPDSSMGKGEVSIPPYMLCESLEEDRMGGEGCCHPTRVDRFLEACSLASRAEAEELARLERLGIALAGRNSKPC